MGMPASVRPIAERESDLAACVLTHCRFRLNPPRRLRPIDNPTGYIATCLLDPPKMGFTRDSAGRWQVPVNQPPASQAVSREQRQRRAEKAYQRWKALTDPEREKVYARTIKAFRFLEYYPRDAHAVVSHSVKMMQQMEEEGLL